MIHYLSDGRAWCDCGDSCCLMNPARLGLDPYSTYDEGALMAETIIRFNQEKKPLTIDFNDPEHRGGGWLQPIRDAAEKVRRAAVKAARKAKPKK